MGQDPGVRCPACDHENPASANFCSQCGTGLHRVCARCGVTAPAGSRFCAQCGTPLGMREDVVTPDRPDETDPTGTMDDGAGRTGTPGDPGWRPPADAEDADLARYLPRELLDRMRSAQRGHAMQGERRTVTILFADIQGSTAAAEALDPEDWAVIVNGAFERLIAPVYRYEGTLARLQGDAVLAFFGAPIAHEDDPVRALRAGLEIIDEIRTYSVEVEHVWRIPLEVRVGVNTGLVVVGEVGSDLRVEYTALGDAINVAARMEQSADPGTVRVTRETLSLTAGAFEAEDLGAVEVKGRSEPVPSRRVVRFTGRPEDDAELPIVGREAELTVLDELCHRLRSGSGWITSVIADAGVGKSRLLHEVRRRAERITTLADRYDAPGEVAWLRGLSRSYDATSPLSTVADVLRRWWGAERLDAQLVAGAVRAVGIDDPDVPALLAHLAGVDLSGRAETFIAALATPTLHRRVGAALSQYLAAVAAQRPTVLVLEDLHWADELSLALVADVEDLTESSPIGLMMAMRPYREEPTWHLHEMAERDHHHRYHHMDLKPLGAEHGRQLVDALPDASAVPGVVKDAILRRSEGNPLFIEEMIRAVRGGGDLAGTTLPTSLAGMLTARLDRLPEGAHYAVQVASVLGSAFDRDLLHALLPRLDADPVTDLLRREILRESDAAPGVVAFRHPLIQETAYSTILRRTRRAMHRQVADHLIGHDPDAASEIARHLVEADDPEAAFPYLVEAGRRAARAMALGEAIRLLGTAVDHVPEDAPPELVERAHDALGEAYSMVPDLTRAAASYQRLFSFGEDAARTSAQVTALNRLGLTRATLAADLDGARTYLEQARHLAESCGDERGLAEYHMNACFIASLGGSLSTALEHDQATIEIGEQSSADDIRVTGSVRKAINLAVQLDRDGASSAIDRARRAAEEAGMEEPRALVDALGASLLRYADGDLVGFVEQASASGDVLERYGSFHAGINRRNLGLALYQLGDIEGALSHFVEGRRIAERAGQPFIVGSSSSGMALAYATAGLAEPIDDLRTTTMRAIDGPLGDFVATSCFADLGWVDLFSGDMDGALSRLRRGLETSSVTQFLERPRLQSGLVLALVRRARQDGIDAAAAAEALEEASATLQEARAFVERTRYRLFDGLLSHVSGELLLARGDLDGADDALVAAHREALDGGQRLLTLQVLDTRARLAAAQGRGEEERAHREALRRVVETIAGGMLDTDLRDSLVMRWTGAATAPDAAGTSVT